MSSPLGSRPSLFSHPVTKQTHQGFNHDINVHAIRHKLDGIFGLHQRRFLSTAIETIPLRDLSFQIRPIWHRKPSLL
jgi:hypothetical protein